MPDYAHRIVQIVIAIFILFFVAGGGITRQETLQGGMIRTTRLTIYTKLPPPPAGPSYCDVVTWGAQGIALPCDFKPPFIGWLQGGKY